MDLIMQGLDPHIALEGVTLKLPLIGASRSHRSSDLGAVGGEIERVGGRARVVALRDVSIRLEHGDRLALVGHNGSGKTTLLRLLAGIYQPTDGTRAIHGRVSCIFSAGLGLRPQATGWENIRLACALYGLTRGETREAEGEIAEFSQLGEYLDLPLGSYSAGMRMRLGFSIVTSMQPDILLVDEVFGAGDRSFYKRARNRLEAMLEKSCILVFASHDTGLLSQFCTMGVRLKRGQIEATGSLEEVLASDRAAP